MGDTRQKGSPLTEGPTPGATSGSSANRDEQSQERPKRAKRSFLTQNACTRCRSKKSKCDGRRPVCERCEKHGTECIYDVAQEGLTRMQNLQQQLETRTADHNRMQSLFDMLQNGSDQEATTLLARLRMGATVDDLTGTIPSMSPQTPSFPSQSQQPLQQTAYTPTWAPSPTGDWGSWAGTESRSMSISSIRDDTQAPPGAYYDPNQLQQEPASPYYFSVAERYGSRAQDRPNDAMQWQEQGEPSSGYQQMQGPSGQMPGPSAQMPGPSAQMPGDQMSDGQSSGQQRGRGQPGGSQKRKA